MRVATWIEAQALDLAAPTVKQQLAGVRRLWVRLHEKGGKRHALPCHHNLEAWLLAYIEGAGLASDPKGPLFCTIGRGTGRLTRTSCPRLSTNDGGATVYG